MSETAVVRETTAEKRKYLRFPAIYRIEHWVQFASFTILALTGLPQKYSEAAISKSFIGLLGGIEVVRTIHRAAATILMVAVVYHIGAVIYRLYVKRYRPSMLPTMVDVRNAIQAVRYNLGQARSRPQQGRYTFEEKVEYWAFAWGTVIMVITGFMLWNPIATARFFPGQFIPAAKAAHGGEALLAVLAIILWHMYHVHVREFNRSMFTGYIGEQEMLHEHPLELADIKAGVSDRPVSAQQVARRKRTFWPVYGIIAALLLFGIYQFVTFEQTAITTVPPAEDVVVFAPLTPTPFPTALPTNTPAPEAAQAATWDEGIGDLFDSKCGACHNDSAKLGGLDLTSYAAAMEGGQSGAVIAPEDPDGSQLVQIQAAGGHPGQLSGDELDQVRDWIEAGAPEN
jgi:formate dehydrogenase gamma subunit